MRLRFRWGIPLLSAALVAALIFHQHSAHAAEPKRPNVLFIAVDDLNHWVGHLGRNAQTMTPNIDRLAAKGTRFTRAYCAAPVCNPSRSALMSGLRPATSGVYDNDDDWRNVIQDELSLVTTFRKAGYLTKGSGKIYHGSFDQHALWDDYLKETNKNPAPKGDTGVGGIKFAPLDCNDDDLSEWDIVQYGIDELKKTHDKPFLLTVGLHKPHMPWNVPRKYYDMHPLDQIQLPLTQENDLSDIPPAGVQMARPNGDHKAIVESGRWKEAVQGYLAAISYCDVMIGRLVDAWDASPERDNTIIVFWGDHGWHLGEKEHWRKFALWEEATHVPYIWVVPGLTQPNTVCERTVDLMSVYPTLTDLCGLPLPAHVEGVTIRPLLADSKVEWTTPALTTFRFGNHAVRSEGWRYIRYNNGDEELYDEQADPHEWTNLATENQKKSHLSIIDELKPFLPAKNAADISLTQDEKPTKGQAKGKGARKKAAEKEDD